MQPPTSAKAHESFADFSTQVARWTGNHWAFLIAAALVIVSLVVFGVEITNIAISIAILLMVLILQNTQNRDSAALHLKLDEMVRVEPDARDDVRGVESRPANEIDELHLDEAEATDIAKDADPSESRTPPGQPVSRGSSVRTKRSSRSRPSGGQETTR